MPLPFAFDPSQALEIAKTFFAGISALAASINVWKSKRDKKEAAKEFDKTFEGTRNTSETTLAAQQLISIIPSEVVADLEKRADKCWANFREVLNGDYLPVEVDEATISVEACVCRELGRIDRLSGNIPDRWQGQWQRYRCSERGLKNRQPMTR